ncbi:D-alanyl-D-alanine carboxypeptidase/D-alanyl-D-alanine endopeptidase [Hoyosella altamirensis]|uniref:D-alanyl-D-alanine carboxypeptidase/D-alanyl-D-alanine-endopeptidase (Penicillin-binding protein 4) n=1 Tax=Hoyosella altamirensis TaxID=616997 RepID=A0A839RLK0_9ACTN|nr:D-alanyl-D-alanine carboxypeptidase/D-alanyl-D-alanine-endopeptidase [Hoyosella altamirensis]MBB3037792.1 D-alanyl-D-alanine carboxypeptidase/D-alanyl-D-alanine-endopeptidase (penicillin-binding protein 4) [Hoyosella altamirensis]
MAEEEAPASPAQPRGEHARSWRLLTAAAFVVVLLVLAGTATLITARYADSFRSGQVHAIAPPPPLVTLEPAILPVSSAAPIPSRDEVAAALAPLLSDPALGSLAGQISDANTGTVLWTQDPASQRIPASSVKLLTAAAALLVIPHDSRAETLVVAGDEPGVAVLIGTGDVTLSGQPDGAATYYGGAARLDDLVAQLRDSDTEISRVLVDTDAYTGARLAPGWNGESVGEGYIAPMEPVMLDGGRIEPLEPESPRWEEPAIAAGRTLAERLGADPAEVGIGSASDDAPVLARVSSAPLRVRVEQAMQLSDNVLAEAIGREVAIAEGEPASFRGAARAVRSVLAEHGVAMDGVDLADTSGLSRDNALPVSVLDGLMVRAAADDDGPGEREEPTGSQQAGLLRPLLDLLPVAAGTGTLEDRFFDSAEAGAGWVRAKTGTLEGVSALTGYVVTQRGRVLTFAFISTDSNAFEARPALDALAAQLRTLPRAGE